MHYMVAALRNLDYDNFEVHWAVTHFGNTESDLYIRRLRELMSTVKWKCNWHIHITHITPAKCKYTRLGVDANGEKMMFPLDLVLNNLRRLRGVFLDGDYDYFLEVGGDNPPPRRTIKRLMEYDVDAASALCFQRPREKEQVAPLAWVYSWTMKDLEQFNLPGEVLEEFRKMFANAPEVLPLQLFKDWKKEEVLQPYCGGTGIVLIKRHVLERVGWRLPPSLYFTEDLHFWHQCNLHGYSTLCDLQFHAPHMHSDGFMY